MTPPGRARAAPRVAGILLAAGAGRRMGEPKALVRDDHGTPWLLRTLRALHDGGVPDVTVVLGAAVAEARQLLAAAEVQARSVTATDWSEGMGASLRRGLQALDGQADTDAALVMLVDLPDVGPDVVARVLAAAEQAVAEGAPARQLLLRARYAGRPGHPVLLGRAHWAGVAALAQGDRGARAYLTAHAAADIECGDLATGRDVDRAP
ncbi:MAG TPA: nucleotidyltransferase family protein [Segeticoccus sp.]|uniref:nucleotidyltransferase family protein n=1 Tax=Segeticoccus sp. TaxID=2706531 RepID=UPI002D808073|nr:nucleotidyltransferase family protein [Segeticoccus sp.]HET8599697.1 nucleotidyltransferase family protein [Segeticoccus sp.]